MDDVKKWIIINILLLKLKSKTYAIERHFFYSTTLHELCWTGLLAIVGKVLQVLLDRVDGIVDVHRPIRHHKVLGQRLGNRHVQDAHEELPHQLPAQRGNKAGTVLHLDENPLEVLRHRHTAQFYYKVAHLETGPFGLDFRLFLGVVVVGDAQHELVKEAVGN